MAESPAEAGGLPLAPLRALTFTVEEGTLMSVDISPDGRLLTFDLLGQVFTVPSGGGRARQLTTGPAFAEQPTFSRDGRFIRFSSDRSGEEGVFWRVPTAGGAPERVPPADTAGLQLFKKEAWGRRPRTLAAPGGRYHVSLGSEENPALSRCRGVGDGDYLEVTDSVAQTTTRIPRVPVCGRWRPSGFLGSAFTSDGRAFVTAWGGKLRRVELATGAVRVIPFRAEVALTVRPLVRFPHRLAEDSLVRARRIEHPQVSPDGRQVVFGAFDRLWVMPLAGGPGAAAPRRLTTLDVGEFEPVWAPDGRTVAFLTWTDSARRGGAIYRVRLDGTGGPRVPERVTPEQEGGRYSHLTYTADGRQLVAVYATKGIWRRGSHVSGMAKHDADPKERHLVWVDAAGGAVRTMRLPRPSWSCHYGYKGAGLGGRATAPAARPGAVLLSAMTQDSGRAVVSLVAVHAPGDAAAADSVTGSPVLQIRFPAHGPMALNRKNCPVVLRSPAGDRALVWSDAQVLYLIDVPPVAGRAVPTVVLELQALRVRPLVTSLAEGAAFPDWAPDGRSFTYADGRTLYRYDIPRADSLVRDSIARAGTRRAVRGPAYRPTALPITVTLPRDRPRGTLVFRDARLLTMQGTTAASAVIERGDLVVRDGRIVALGPSGTVAIPREARVIQATGRTIMPGLVDLHNHIFAWTNIHRTRSWQHEANLAYGVLTSRDPQVGSLDFLTSEDRIAAGGLLAPRIYATGYGIGTQHSRVAERLSLEDARALMQRYAEMYRVGYIKEYQLGPRSARQRLVMAAAERGLNVVTHGSSYRRLVQAAIDGYGGYDHFKGPWPLYADARTLLVQTGMTLAHYMPTAAGDVSGIGVPVLHFAPLMDSLAWLRMWRWREGWETSEEAIGKARQHTLDRRDDTKYRELWHALGEIARVAAAGGRAAVANHGEAPGYGTHAAMWTLVEGGMPVLEALRSGTLRGAEALGMDRELGSLEVGKRADLLVLERNPLERIQHTVTIQAVLFNGRLYDHATLDELWPRPRSRRPGWWQADTP